MINKYIEKTLSLILSDANFLVDFSYKLEMFNQYDNEEKNTMIRNAWAFILHIIDYYVSSEVIDMEADISRLCINDPKKAEELRHQLNPAILSIKSNYQFLLKEGTIYSQYLHTFPQAYAGVVAYYIDVKKGASPSALEPPFPFNYLRYSDIEFISVEDDLKILERKFKTALNLDFSALSVKAFIELSFAWADKIQEYLERCNANKTKVSLDRDKNKPKKSTNQKKEKYGKYESLAECIPNIDIYKKVLDVAAYYYNIHNKIDGVFGYTVFQKLKCNGCLNTNGCAQDHFGELLIKEFGAKCSFKDGGAIYDGKNKSDFELNKKLAEIF